MRHLPALILAAALSPAALAMQGTRQSSPAPVAAEAEQIKLEIKEWPVQWQRTRPRDPYVRGALGAVRMPVHHG
jgi:hypothetical protein